MLIKDICLSLARRNKCQDSGYSIILVLKYSFKQQKVKPQLEVNKTVLKKMKYE